MALENFITGISPFPMDSTLSTEKMRRGSPRSTPLSAACSSALSARGAAPPKMTPTPNTSPGRTAAPTRAGCALNAMDRSTALSGGFRREARAFPSSTRPWERRRIPPPPSGISCAAACRRLPTQIPSALASSNALRTRAWWESCAIILPI